ncbi:MAG: hypothetical protein ACRDQ2_19755 [Gaiellales bacterium]
MALVEVNVCDFAAAAVPAKRGAAESIRRSRVEEENKLEGFVQLDVVKLCCRRKGFSEVMAVEGAPKAAVGMALRGHERMFAYEARDRRRPDRVIGLTIERVKPRRKGLP